MSNATTPSSTPAVKLRIRCSRLRNLSAKSPPQSVDRKAASESSMAGIETGSRDSAALQRHPRRGAQRMEAPRQNLHQSAPLEYRELRRVRLGICATELLARQSSF